MPYLRGEDINIGVGMEDPVARGTIVAPQVWIPGRTPTDIKPEIVKIEIKETRASGVDTQGAEIVQKGAIGGLEFNVRAVSIGYLLKSWLGKCTTGSVLGGGDCWPHVFTILPQNPEHPSLSLGLSQPNSQDYEYGLTLVKSLEIRTPVDDLVNATVGFIAAKEEAKAGAAFDVSFGSIDYRFRHQDITIKIADVVTTEATAALNWTATKAKLAAAAALSLKEFSFGGDNGARFNQNIGELVPGNVLALLQSLKATLKADFVDNIDQTIGDIGATAYSLTTAINEGATHIQTFTPTKKYQTKVVFKVIAKGTGDWSIAIHNAANTLIASETIKNADITVGYNTAILPYTWTTGTYHVHIFSSVADGTIDTDVNDDLEGAVMSFYYKSERELYTGGNYKAMRIEMKRDDIKIATDETQRPTLTIDLSRVSFEGWTPDRPLEDIVTEGVELKIHYDENTAIAIEATLINEQDDYLKA